MANQVPCETCAICGGIGSNLVASRNQTLGQLVDMVFDASSVRVQEITDHEDPVCLRMLGCPRAWKGLHGSDQRDASHQTWSVGVVKCVPDDATHIDYFDARRFELVCASSAEGV